MFHSEQLEFLGELQVLLRKFNRETRTINAIYVDFDSLIGEGNVALVDETDSPRYMGKTSQVFKPEER